jgi:glutamate-5-semialdehyde dehydrogenase
VTSEPPATVAQLGQRAREASRALSRASSAARDEALRCAADLIERRAGEVLEANGTDMARAVDAGADATTLDRLRLSPERIEGMARGLRSG